MIPKLLCWLFGHKILVKAFTGETMAGKALYKWERRSFCLRCGKNIAVVDGRKL